MISMVLLIDTSFPSSAGVFPDGYHEVDCSTCHRGNVKPETVAPSKFYNRGNSLGNPPPAQVPGVSLKLLPVETHVHGADSLMGEFRDALRVDCNYCHGGGKPQEWDLNPRKDIARKMIMLVRQINAQFPGTAFSPWVSRESRAGPATAAIRIPSAWAIRRILRRSQSREGNVYKRHKVEPQKAQKLLLLCLFVIFIVPFVIHSPFG